MPDENKETITNQSDESTKKETDLNSSEKPDNNTQSTTIKEPDLADDFLKLQQMNILKAITIKMQGGHHSDKATDELLERRMSFNTNEIQGPVFIRLLNTFMFIFICIALSWALIWAIATLLKLTQFIILVSRGLTTLFAVLIGIALFHPSSSLDEAKLKKAIEKKMETIKEELATTTNNNKQTQSKTNSDNHDSSPVENQADNTHELNLEEQIQTTANADNPQ